MKDIKIDNKIYNEDFDITFTVNLPIEQIKLIVDNLIEVDDVVDRKIMLDWYLLMFGTDIGIDEHIDIEKYNYFLQVGLIDLLPCYIKSERIISDLLYQAESIENTIKKLAGSLESQTDKMIKKMPSKQKLEKIISEMKDNGTENKLKS